MLVDDLYAFELGGVRFEVYATPGGEGPDAVSLWIPEWKVLFAGDEKNSPDSIALLISGVVRVYKIGATGREITLYRFV